jgi:hypothetical protein
MISSLQFLSQFLARSVLVFLSVALILIWGDRAVQAQLLSQTGTDAEIDPNPDQPPSRSPDDQVPDDQAPDQQPQPRQPRRHIGIGGSIGVSGEDTGLSEGGFAIMSRYDLNNRLSIRGTSVFGNTRTDNAMALTVNFPIRSSSGEAQLIPFVGGGVLISSKSLFDDLIVRGLVTGGIDMPISRRFTASTAVNVGFTDRANVGVRLGVMYGF